jgi:hypothetical protein
MAQVCSMTLGGISLDCTTNQGGIKEVWIAPYSEVKPILTKVTPKEDIMYDGNMDEYKMVTGFTEGDISKFKKYEFRRGTASLTETLTSDETNGVNYVTQELSLVFTKKDTIKRVEMAALSVGQLALIVRDCNDKYFYMGIDDYVSASAGGSESGTAKGDRNAYTITLKTESATYAYEVDAEMFKPKPKE